MEKSIRVQVTEEGILIPREALGELDEGELEAIRETGRIVIQLRPQSLDERNQVRQVLRDAGLLYEPSWSPPSPVSQSERARLAQKLGSGPPLSEEIIAEREDRV